MKFKGLWIITHLMFIIFFLILMLVWGFSPFYLINSLHQILNNRVMTLEKKISLLASKSMLS